MIPALRYLTYDLGEANFGSAFVNLVSASLAVSALVNNEWILVESSDNSTSLDPATEYIDLPGEAKCNKIGTRDFWNLATFGGYIDRHGRQHTAFRTDGRIMWDCVTPFVANLFYMLIALCFVICLTSSSACLLHVLSPPHGFLSWLRKNTILEMCNMMLTLVACGVAMVAESAVSSLRENSDVSVGPGLFLLTLSGLLSFLAALLALRHVSKIQRVRRLDNQRIMCARSLRSWRDMSRRTEDTRPIVDFERRQNSVSQHLTGSMFLPIVLIALTSLIQASNALGLSFPPCDAGEFYAFERAGCRRCSECGDNEYISEKCGVYNDVMCSPCDEPQRDNPDYIDSCIGHPYSPILVKKLSREMKITQNAIRKLTRNERIPLDNIQKLYHEFDAELGQDIADNVEEISKTEEELDKEMEEESVDEAIHLEMKEADQDDSAQVDEDLHEITKKLKKFGESNVRRRSGTFVRGTQYIYRSPIRLIPLEFVNRLEEIPFESEEYDQENDLEEYEAEDASLADEDEALNEKEREVEGLLSQHDDDITGTLLQFGDKSVENPPFTDADFDSNEPMLLSRVPAVRMVGDEYANRFTGRLFDEGVFSDEVDPDSEESDERMDDFNSLERQREPILIKRSDWLKMISDDEHTDGTDSDSDEYIDDYEEGSAFGDRLSIKGIFMICFITSILLVFYLLFVHRLVCSHRYRIDRLPQMDEEQEAFIERCAEGQNIHVYENKLVENI